MLFIGPVISAATRHKVPYLNVEVNRYNNRFSAEPAAEIVKTEIEQSYLTIDQSGRVHREKLTSMQAVYSMVF